MKRWEYLIERTSLTYKVGGAAEVDVGLAMFNEYLNKRGADGWEYISHSGSLNQDGSGETVFTYFKRQRQEK